MRSFRFAHVCAVVVLAACGSESGRKNGLGIDDGASEGAEVSEVVGLAPLTLRLKTGARMDVPTAALARGTTLTMRRPPDDEAVTIVRRLPANWKIASAPYVVAAGGRSAAEMPVSLTLPIVRGAETRRLVIAMRPASGEETWIPLSTPAQVGSELTVMTMAFGTFVIAQPSETGSEDDEAPDAGPDVPMLGSCSSGTFDSDPGAGRACVAWSVCPRGTYVSIAGSATRDRACSPCGEGTFSERENATSCETYSDCAPGSAAEAGATKTSDRSCRSCSYGTFTTQTNAATCQPWSNCAAGTFVSAEGTTTSDRQCAPCAAPMFSAQNNAYRCESWSTCQPGTFVSNTPSAAADRQCTTCATGTTTTEPNLGMCVPLDGCAPGSYQIAPGYGNTPPQCQNCEAGTYCAGGTESRVACASGTWDHDANSATACVPQTVCAPGFYMTAAGTATSDRTCTACAQGTFSSVMNATACMPKRDCSYGWIVANTGDATTNRTCSSCPAGSTTGTLNATSCDVKAVAISAGDYHTCVLLSDGNVRCWGAAGAGLGRPALSGRGNIGDDEPVRTAGNVELGVGSTKMVTGHGRACALGTAGGLRCWGSNSYGALGYGNQNTIGDDETPASVGDVALGGSAAQVAIGTHHTCATLTDGRVRCWGYNYYGELGLAHTDNIGDDETPASESFVDVGGSALQVAAGTHASCALLSAGNVRCWGYNGSYYLGYAHTNTIGDNETPASAGDIPLGATAAQIDGGNYYQCALTTAGNVRCWGNSSWLGYGTSYSYVTPDQRGDIPLGATATQISVGASHACALLTDGNVRCWGDASGGKLGYGNTNSIGDDETPASAGNVSVGGRVVQIAAGQQHTCALLEDGNVRCWGYGYYGTLGNGSSNIGDDELPSSVPAVSY